MTTAHLRTMGFTIALLAFVPFTPAVAQTSVTPADARANPESMEEVENARTEHQ